jgi:hypothetical protein
MTYLRTLKSFSIILLLTLIVSCNSASEKENISFIDSLIGSENLAVKQNLVTEIESCEDIQIEEVDTFFLYDIKFHMKTLCNESIKIYDTIQLSDNSKKIVGFREISYEINIKTPTHTQKIKVSKESFGDSLALDMRERGVLTNPWEIKFEKSDTTIRLRSFIGFPQSDFGDNMYYKIDTRGKLTVLRIENPVLGD